MTVKIHQSIVLLLTVCVTVWIGGKDHIAETTAQHSLVEQREVSTQDIAQSVDSSVETLVKQALVDDQEASEQALVELRQFGVSAIDGMLAARPARSKKRLAHWQRTLDAICRQRDCAHSKLYWYTDLDLAVAEAQRSGRPILSLRLLGRLDEELSCANSRFFRSVLYPDPRVSDLMRRGFVLHWSSERPVPKMHIDFGEGRTLEGTITGNSAHYILDSQGRVVDGLPGLYGPGLFLSRLTVAATLAERLSGLDDGRFLNARAAAHRDMLAMQTTKLWPMKLHDTGQPGDPTADGSATPELTHLEARLAGERAMSKMVVEAPVLDAISLSFGGTDPNRQLWQILAADDPWSWNLSPESHLLLRSYLAGFESAEAERSLSTIMLLVGIDSMRNEYELHGALHTWLADAEESELSMEGLNARVYSELFLTPASDPWLGLASVETYLALSGVAPR